MGFPKARPGAAFTMDVAANPIESDIEIPDGVGTNGTLVWIGPKWVDTAPSVGEGMAGIFSLDGEWPHRPTEVPFPTGGTHLEATGARHLTAGQKWRINQPVSAGQVYSTRGETYDTVASDGRAFLTSYYETTGGLGTQIYSKFTRETTATSAGETALANLTLDGAGTIIEGIGINVPTGTVTANIEVAGRFIVRSDSLSPVNEVSWDAEPFEAIEATSGGMEQAGVWRQEMVLFSSVPSVIINSAFDVDVAITTQTHVAGVGFRYFKRVPTTNPRMA